MARGWFNALREFCPPNRINPAPNEDLELDDLANVIPAPIPAPIPTISGNIQALALNEYLQSDPSNDLDFIRESINLQNEGFFEINILPNAMDC